MGKLREEHPVRLTDIEVTDRSYQLSKIIGQIEDLEAQAKTTAGEFKAEIKDLKIQVADLAGVLRERQEMRAVDLVEEYDHEKGKVHVVRADTMEVVRIRDMTMEERQLVLFHGEARAVGQDAGRPFDNFATPSVDSVSTPEPQTITNEVAGEVVDNVPASWHPSPELEPIHLEDPQRKPAKSTRKQCKATNKRGNACKQPARLDSEYCKTHYAEYDNAENLPDEDEPFEDPEANDYRGEDDGD